MKTSNKLLLGALAVTAVLIITFLIAARSIAAKELRYGRSMEETKTAVQLESRYTG
jgi:hypothetical protein